MTCVAGVVCLGERLCSRGGDGHGCAHEHPESERVLLVRGEWDVVRLLSGSVYFSLYLVTGGVCARDGDVTGHIRRLHHLYALVGFPLHLVPACVCACTWARRTRTVTADPGDLASEKTTTAVVLTITCATRSRPGPIQPADTSAY